MVRRVGSVQNVSVNVRIIAAMNVHPSRALQEQKLRSDLYYRLNVFTFSLLPIRERKDDILFLSDYFIQSFNRKLQKSIQGLDGKLELFFLGYKWPGNVRELKHTIEYMMNISEGQKLFAADLPVMMRQQAAPTNQREIDLSLRKNIAELEQRLIDHALKLTEGNIKQAAKLLEIPRQTLQYKMKKTNQ